MIFGIMGAMPDEVDQLCAKLENVTVEPYGGVDYHKGTLAGKQVVVCLSLIHISDGKITAAKALGGIRHLLQRVGELAHQDLGQDAGCLLYTSCHPVFSGSQGRNPLPAP